MEEAELIEMIIKKRNELEENRAIKVSRSLIRVQEEEIKDLENVYAAGEAARQALRPFLDLCAEKYDVGEVIADSKRVAAKKAPAKEEREDAAVAELFGEYDS